MKYRCALYRQPTRSLELETPPVKSVQIDIYLFETGFFMKQYILRDGVLKNVLPNISVDRSIFD